MRYSVLSHFGLALSLMVLPAYAHASDIESSSKISSVLVFPNGAQITREFSVDVPAGAHDIILKDLPARLQGHSLRVEGHGPKGLEIGSVDQKVVTIPFEDITKKALTKQLKEQLDQLLHQRALHQSEVEAVELQKKLLNEMTLLPSRQVGRGEGNAGTDLAGQYERLYTLMGQKFVDAQARALTAKIKIKDLNKEIKNVELRLREHPQGKKQATRLVVNVLAANGGVATFKVRYQVHGAGWRPSYEVRLNTKNEEAGRKDDGLKLVRRAQIFQRTSEDWDNVSLTLSTTNPSGRTKAPDLSAWFVDFRKDVKPAAPVAQFDMMQEPRETKRRLRIKPSMGGKLHSLAKKEAAVPRRAQVSFGTYQMTFKVPDLTSVKRDGEQRQVFLDEFAFSPKVSLFTVPKKDKKAYLHAIVKNQTGQALLAGNMALFRDGVYVGNSHMKAIEPGQDVNIGFGVDPNVNVTWVRLDRVKGETGLISSSNSDVHRYKITITNGHKKPMPVTVFDQMPYAEHEDLQISLLNSSPKPSRSNVDDKKGVMAWDLIAQPGKSKTIEFGYQLVWPTDKNITLR